MHNRATPIPSPIRKRWREDWLEAHEPCPAKGGAVLVVAVHRTFREKVQAVLLSRGVTAVTTSSEVSALELLSRGNLFDAVVVDSTASVASALALAAQLHRYRPDIPIVLTLAEDEPRVEMQARSSGVYRCVRSTGPEDTLSETLCEAVARARSTRLRRPQIVPAPKGR